MKLLFRYLSSMKLRLTAGLSIKMLATLIELVIPYILSHILDNVVPSESISAILLWGGAMILCAAAALIGNTVANRIAAKTSRDMTEAVRHDLFQKTMSLSCRTADRFTIPSLEARLTSDTYNLHNMVGMMQRIGVRAPLLLIGGLIVTLVLDARLALIMIAALPIMVLVILFVSKCGIPMYSGVQERVDGMVRVVREDAQGIRVIKALSKKDLERRRFDGANRALIRAERNVSFVMSLSNPVMQLFLNLGLVAVVLFGAYLVNGDISQPGKIIGFQQYFTLISMAMLTMTRIFIAFSKGIASAERIREVLDSENELVLRSENDFPRRVTDDHVRFEKVTFSYGGVKPTVKDISFSLGHGQTLGIIGATGSGKTTLLQLLMRFYDVDEGHVRIDGRDVRTIPDEQLHRMFGVARQNDFLYSDTIRANVDFGRGLSDDDIRRAIELAQAAEFVDALPEGLDHMLTTGGTNLSGGQRQRLLIARALAGSPEIVLLDDSSSALDYKTDLALRRAVTTLDSTLIVVAQRVSSVMNSDLILVIEEGEIVGAGTHATLMESCDIYREISESQMGGAFVE